MQERVPSNLTLTFEEISEARIYCLRQAQGSFSFDIHPLQRGKAVANTANTFIHGLRERPALCRWAPIKVATTGGSQASNSSAETSFPTYFRRRTQDTSSSKCDSTFRHRSPTILDSWRMQQESQAYTCLSQMFSSTPQNN